MKRERAQEREQEDGEYIDDIAAKDDGDVQDDE